jgi:signal transduction histidine kinase
MAVESAIDRTASAVRRFSRLAGMHCGQEQPLSLEKVLGQVLELRSREWERLGIGAVVGLEPAPSVNAHEGQLQLAFLHLLINAEEAAVRNPSQHQIGVRSFYDASQRKLRVEIEDSGPGIPSSVRDQIFRPFFTTKAPGTATGLGLTTVRNIIERYHGRVWFETTRKKGTTFIVEFPDSAE